MNTTKTIGLVAAAALATFLLGRMSREGGGALPTPDVDKNPVHEKPASLPAPYPIGKSGDADAVAGITDLLSRDAIPTEEELFATIEAARDADELEAMFEEAIELPKTSSRKSAIEKILFELGKVDGRRALQLAGSFSEPGLKSDALAWAYRGWGSKDPTAAWQYATSLPAEVRVTEPYDFILFGATTGDLGVAFDFVEQYYEPLSNSSYEKLRSALHYIYDHRDPDAMKGWIEELPSGGLKNLASNELIDRWAKLEPKEALRWMEDNVDLSANSHARYELVESWARVAPDEAVGWLTDLPSEAQDPQYYHALFKRWLQVDQLAAANWLVDAEPSPLLDGPFEKYAAAIMATDPAEAMNWASSITDGEYRTRVMRNVAQVWGRNDPDGLAQFVSNDPAGAVLQPTQTNSGAPGSAIESAPSGQ